MQDPPLIQYMHRLEPIQRHLLLKLQFIALIKNLLSFETQENAATDTIL
jgi:hypothetical protein